MKGLNRLAAVFMWHMKIRVFISSVAFITSRFDDECRHSIGAN